MHLDTGLVVERFARFNHLVKPVEHVWRYFHASQQIVQDFQFSLDILQLTLYLWISRGSSTSIYHGIECLLNDHVLGGDGAFNHLGRWFRLLDSGLSGSWWHIVLWWGHSHIWRHTRCHIWRWHLGLWWLLGGGIEEIHLRWGTLLTGCGGRRFLFYGSH